MAGREEIEIGIGLRKDATIRAAKEATAIFNKELQNVRMNIQQSARNTLTGTGANVKKGTEEHKKLADATGKANQAAEAFNNTTSRGTKIVETFGERIGFTAARFGAYALAATAIYKVASGLQFAKDSAIELDVEVNRLTQVLDGNVNKAKEVATATAQIATKYGQSAAEILKITDLLAQSGEKFSGKNLLKAVDALSKTKILATFGSIEETTKGSLAALNQFNLAASDLNEILDITNVLSKRFAVESGDFFTAVQSGGAAFAAAGGNVKEFATTVAALRDVTRLSASTIGTGLNTIALRLIRPDVVSFLDDFTGGQIRDAQGNLKGINDILIEVGNSARGINTEEFGKLINVVSGTRQGKLLVPLLKDIGNANSVFKKAQESISNSAGSVNKDTLIGLERLDVVLGSVGGKFQEAFLEIAKDQDFKNFIKELASIAKFLADILKAATPLVPILSRLAVAALAMKAISIIPQIAKGVTTNFGKLGPLGASGYESTIENAIGIATGTQSSKKGRIPRTRKEAMAALGAAVSGQASVGASDYRSIFYRQLNQSYRGAGTSGSLQALSPFDYVKRKISKAEYDKPVTSEELLLKKIFPSDARAKILARTGGSQFFPSRLGTTNAEIRARADFRSRPPRIIQGPSRQFRQQMSDVSLFTNEERALQEGIKERDRLTKSLATTRKLINKEVSRLQKASQSIVYDPNISPMGGFVHGKFSQKEIANAVSSNVALYQSQKKSLAEVNKAVDNLAKNVNAAKLSNISSKNLRLAGAGTTPNVVDPFFTSSIRNPRNRSNFSRATSIQAQRALLRAGGFGRQIGGAIKSTAPITLGIGLGLLGDQITGSQEGRLSDIVDEKGELKQDFRRILRRNRQSKTIAGAGQGLSIGAGIGGAIAGTAALSGVGLPIALALLAGSALIGTGTGVATGSASGLGLQRDQLIAAAAGGFTNIDPKTKKRKLGALGKLTKDLLKDKANPFGNTIGEYFLGGDKKDISELFSDTLKTEQGTALQDAIQKSALDLARSGKFTKGSAQGEIRNQLVSDVREQLKKDAPNLSSSERQSVALGLVAESLRNAGSEFLNSLDGLNTEAANSTSEFNIFNAKLSQANHTLELFVKGFDETTQKIQLKTSIRDVNTNLSQQLFGGITGQGGGFKIPPEVANNLVQSILQNTKNKSTSDVAGEFRQNLGGLLSSNEIAKFADVLQVSRLAESGSENILSRIAGKDFTKVEGESTAASLERILNQFFKEQNVQLNTPEGTALKTQVTARALELTRTNPEQFGNNFAAALTEAAKGMSTLDPVLSRVLAVIANINSNADAYRQGLQQELDIKQRLVQSDIQSSSTKANRISSLGAFGISSLQTGSALSDLANGLPGINLSASSNKLMDAQRKRVALETLGGGTLASADSKARADAEVQVANAEYANNLDLTNQKITILRKAFDDLTQSLNQQIEASQKIGTSSFQTRARSAVDLGVFKQSVGGASSLRGILGNVDNEREFGLALQEGRITEKDILEASRQAQMLSNNPRFLRSQEGAGLFGQRGSGFRAGQTNAGAIGITNLLAGFSGPGGAQALKEFIDTAQKQGSLFGQANTIENQQLTELKAINQNLAQLVLRAGGTPGGTPNSGTPSNSPKTIAFPASQPSKDIPPSVSKQKATTESSILGKLGDFLKNTQTKVTDETLKVLQSIDKALAGKQGAAQSDVKVEGSFNFTGFESTPRDQVAIAAVRAIMGEFIKQLKGGNIQERQTAAKLENAVKVFQNSPIKSVNRI